MHQDPVKTAFHRSVKALSLRPRIGQGTAVTRAVLHDGVRCEVEEGPWRITVDMAEKAGGGGAGPNPGVLGRGALASCMVVGYSMWAAYRDLPLAHLAVTVEADYDARADYGVGDVPPGYGQIRCLVEVESEAPEEDVLRLLDEADSHSTFLTIFARAQDLRREVRVSRPRPEDQRRGR